MDCFLETNLFDLPHECAAHFVLWTVTIFYHLFSFPCRALGERNIFDPAILQRRGAGDTMWEFSVGEKPIEAFGNFFQSSMVSIRVKWVGLILAQQNKCSLGWWN